MDADTPKASDRRQATVLFAEITRARSAGPAGTPPDDLAPVLEDCFGVIERVIAEYGGTLDKYIGDTAMALFGAPRALEEAPKQAVNAAVEMREHVTKLFAERALTDQLRFKVGINTGLVVAGEMGGEVRRDYTVMGSTVNMAARLLKAARAQQILVGETTFRDTSNNFQFRPTPPLKLKGIPAPTVAYEVLSREAQQHRSSATKRRDGVFSPIVGRASELAALENRFRQLSSGIGGVVTVVAEPGIGKSRLLAEARESDACEGLSFLEGRAHALGRTLSFYPFNEILRQWAGIAPGMTDGECNHLLADAVAKACGGDAAEVLPFVRTMMGYEVTAAQAEMLNGITPESREKLVRSNAVLLLTKIAAASPLVLLFEDLHWADDSSLSLLETLLPAVRQHPVLVMAAFRPGYESTSERTAAFVRSNMADVHLELRLRPLESRDCDALVENLLGTANLPQSLYERIKETTEGNPFYIEEVLRSLVESRALVQGKDGLAAAASLGELQIPRSVEEVIMSRVDRLEPVDRDVLQVAAVIGRRIHRQVFDLVAPGGVDLEGALDNLVAKGFLLEESSRRTSTPRRTLMRAQQEYIFKHALTQQAIYGSLLKKTRREMHLRCAEAAERVFENRLHDAYGLLAYHWGQAERLDKAEQYLFMAGEQATRAAASAEALQFFREAYRVYLLVHGDKADRTKKALLEKNIGFALLNSGRLVESIAHMNNALRFYGQWVPARPFAVRLKVALDLPAVLFHLYWPSGERARRPRPNDVDIYQTMYNRCRAQNPTDPERSFFDNLATGRLLHRVDPSRIEHAVGMYAANGAFFAFAGLSFACAYRFLAAAEAILNPERVIDRMEFLCMSSVVDFHAGEWSGVHDPDDELLARALRAGLLWDADIFLGFACEREMRKGNFDAARVRLAQLDHVVSAYGYEFSRSTIQAMTAYLLLEQRKLDEAREAMQAYHDARHEDQLRVFALSGLARIDVLQGRPDDAARRLERAKALVERAGRMPAFYTGAYHASMLHLNLARLEAGEAKSRAVTRELATALATVRNIARDRVECYRLAARTEVRIGRPRRALKLWAQALDEGERLGVRPELARTYADIGFLLPATGSGTRFRDHDASYWSEAAAALYEQLGLPVEQLPAAASWNGERSERPHVAA